MIVTLCTNQGLQFLADLMRQVPTTGPSSPLAVNCPRCSAPKLTGCFTHAEGHFCRQRTATVLQVLLKLPTYAIPFITPCHGKKVWLCWRAMRDDLDWINVPCPDCTATYTVQRFASDWPITDRMLTDRLHPQMLEVTCWAIE